MIKMLSRVLLVTSLFFPALGKCESLPKSAEDLIKQRLAETDIQAELNRHILAPSSTYALHLFSRDDSATAASRAFGDMIAARNLVGTAPVRLLIRIGANGPRTVYGADFQGCAPGTCSQYADGIEVELSDDDEWYSYSHESRSVGKQRIELLNLVDDGVEYSIYLEALNTENNETISYTITAVWEVRGAIKRFFAAFTNGRNQPIETQVVIEKNLALDWNENSE